MSKINLEEAKRGKQLQYGAWALSSISVLLALLAWLRDHNWQLAHLSSYTLFPLFGLLAFSLMWSHYIVAAIRKYYRVPSAALGNYFEVTSLGVLAAILLHPGLLVYRLWRDGFGLPPASYKSYVAPGMVWIVILGTISLFIFLAFELRRFYKNHIWWKYVQYASDAAMAAIFYHSLRLGMQLQGGWLRGVWFLYGLTYIIALVVMYVPKLVHKQYN